MAPSEPTRLRYDLLLAALGRFAEEHRLSDLCILEFEEGVIMQGTTLVQTVEGYKRSAVTHVLSRDDIKELVRNLVGKKP